MIVIADSGSTKVDWRFVDCGKVFDIHTEGINPVHQTDNCILGIIKRDLLPSLRQSKILDDCAFEEGKTVEIFFYGAGCTEPNKQRMVSLLRSCFARETLVEVYSDMLGAARALFGNGEGIACILGTGSNSCHCKGGQIISSTPSLGYILGDEGSGAVLGRMFLNATLKGLIPTAIRDEYLEYMSMTVDDIITAIYHSPTPNRFLASVSLYVAKHIDIPDIKALVIDNFRSFIQKNIIQYNCPNLEIGAVGSIAYSYSELLREAINAENMKIEKILKSPLEGLTAYHCGKI